MTRTPTDYRYTSQREDASVGLYFYREASLWDKPCPLRCAPGVLREGEIRSWWKAGLSTTPAYKLPVYSFTGQFSYMDDPSTAGVTED